MEKNRLTARMLGKAQAWPYMQQAAEFDTTGGLQSLDEVLARSLFQGIESDGELIGAYALQLNEHSSGNVLWITACAARIPGRDLTSSILELIEQQGRQVGAVQTAIHTRRPGLVKKMQALGYEITGYTLRKKI